MPNPTLSQYKAFPTLEAINLEAFAKLCTPSIHQQDYPNAHTIEKKVVLYKGDQLRALTQTEKEQIKAELHHCLKNGPGVFVIQNFYPDHKTIDQSTAIFKTIIQIEKQNRVTAADHFAKAGNNERIWNSFQKVAAHNPAAFIDYYKNPLYALVSEAWLGPAYQITAQVNIVKPGGQPQSAHRDYHLGFQSAQQAAQYPLSMQIASQYLTLQGGIAHSNMPIETGPTLLLPFSQQYELGYLAFRDEAFQTYFKEHCIQLSLNKGDALFFSPALFHAAGSNSTNGDRISNLVQISSAFGKPMESINRYKIMQWTYPILLEQQMKQLISEEEIQAIIAAIADGYAFPTNLDVVPPVGGLAPETAAALMARALREQWSVVEFNERVYWHERERG